MALPVIPEPITGQHIAIYTNLSSAEIVPAVRREVHNLEPGAAVFGVRTMDQVIAGSYSVSHARLMSTLLSAFAVLALLIATFGL